MLKEEKRLTRNILGYTKEKEEDKERMKR